jgi:head-tail adaptor
MSAEFAGALDQRVTVRRRAADRDDLGGAAGGWGEGAAVWAALTPMAARGADGDRPVGRARWRAVVRSGVEVVPGDRLVWRSCDFAVRSVVADPAAPDRLTLVVEEEG